MVEKIVNGKTISFKIKTSFIGKHVDSNFTSRSMYKSGKERCEDPNIYHDTIINSTSIIDDYLKNQGTSFIFSYNNGTEQNKIYLFRDPLNTDRFRFYIIVPILEGRQAIVYCKQYQGLFYCDTITVEGEINQNEYTIDHIRDCSTTTGILFYGTQEYNNDIQKENEAAESEAKRKADIKANEDKKKAEKKAERKAREEKWRKR